MNFTYEMEKQQLQLDVQIKYTENERGSFVVILEQF